MNPPLCTCITVCVCAGAVPLAEFIEFRHVVDMRQEVREGSIALQLGMPTQRHAEFGGDNPLEGFVLAPTVATVTTTSMTVTSTSLMAPFELI